MFILILAIIIITLFLILIIDIAFSTTKENQTKNEILQNSNENQNLEDEAYNRYLNLQKEYNNKIENNITTSYNNYNEDLEKYIAKEYIMTKTEIKFYIKLKKITDELNMTIFPQVDLERIIKVSDNNYRDRNRIKSRNIDYTIVKNTSYKILCCIELDDYTHNTRKAQKADNFKNELFEKVKIPLHRIKVNSYYDKEEIKKILQQDLLKN